MSELPPYIRRGGDVVLEQPFAQTGVRSFVFLLHADTNALSALCDAQLNAVSRAAGVEYRPLAPLAALIAADIPHMQSARPPDADKGWISEKDVAFWIPVCAGRDDGGRFVPERVVWFLPYIWVDNPPAMANGREIYGFPKEAGRIAIPRPGDAFEITAEALVIPHYGKASETVVRQLVHVTPSSAGALGQLVSQGQALRDLLGTLAGTLLRAIAGGTLDGDVVRDLIQDALHERVPMVFLKQFRDAERPDRACYQAIVEANARVTRFAGGGPIPGAHRVHVADWDSHPIVRDLGLEGADPEVLVDAWAEFDFEMEAGRIVARST
jgi:hypothetical protein